MWRVPGRADGPGPGDAGPAGIAAGGSRGSGILPPTPPPSPLCQRRPRPAQEPQPASQWALCAPAQPCTPRPGLCSVHKHPGNLRAGFVFPKTMPFFFLKAPLHTQVGKVSRGPQRGLEEMGDHSPASPLLPARAGGSPCITLPSKVPACHTAQRAQSDCWVRKK